MFEASADSMEARSEVQEVEVRELNQQPLYRSAVVAEVARAADDPDVVEFTFSSEQPVERYFGMEVLSHDPDAMNMARLNSGAAPWLWNHNPEVVLGVVERAWMGDDRRGRGADDGPGDDRSGRDRGRSADDSMGRVDDSGSAADTPGEGRGRGRGQGRGRGGDNSL
jgi:hypothetical protein